MREATATTTARLRVVFDDPRILSSSQELQGLHRSWLLLSPQRLPTIRDVASHLLCIFNLHRSCPNGLLLSMDGFVLPPLESSSILKDNDTISVKRKQGTLPGIVGTNGESNSLEGDENIEKQPIFTGLKLLANEEFEEETKNFQSESEEDKSDFPCGNALGGTGNSKKRKAPSKPASTSVKVIANGEFEKETGGYLSEPEEDISDEAGHISPVGKANSKKRKAPKKLESSKRKKKCPANPEDVGNDSRTKKHENYCHSKLGVKKISPKKRKSSAKSRPDTDSYPANSERNIDSMPSADMRKKKCPANPEDVGNDSRTKKREKSCHSKLAVKKISPKKRKSSTKRTPDTDSYPANSERNIDSMPNPDMCVGLQENANESFDVSNLADGIIKVPSRSARRKKAKRKWLRELVKAEKIANAEKMAKVEKKLVNEGQTLDNVVHRVTTDHQQLEKSHEKEDEVIPVVVRPGHIRFEFSGEERVVEQNRVPLESLHWNGITSKKKGKKWGAEKFSSQRSHYKDFEPECLETAPLVESITVNDPVDFDKLRPLVCLPKEGDVIAYRLLELSWLWTPELSSFRVGKVSSYDPESYKIVLIPVPEYPIIFEKKSDEDASEGPLDCSLYKEDGSLETSFTALIDVRVFELGHSHPGKAVSNGACPGIQDAVSDPPAKVNNKDWDAPTSGIAVAVVNNGDSEVPNSGSGDVNVWDEISQALIAKKTELSREDGFSKKDSSLRITCPYRAPRRDALGTIVALLRSKNDF